MPKKNHGHFGALICCSKLLTAAIFLCLSLLVNSCEPGVSSRGISSSEDGFEVRLSSEKAYSRLQKLKKTKAVKFGLPDFCLFQPIMTNSLSCLVCNYRGIELKRCMQSAQDFNPSKLCKYTAEDLKCMIKSESRLVKISFNQSEEERFIKNTTIIMETLLQILGAGDADETSEQLRFFLFLTRFFMENTLEIATVGDINFFCQRFRHLLESENPHFSIDDFDGVNQTFLVGITQLQMRRFEGRLGLNDGYKFFSMLAERFITDKKLREIVATLNVRGLIE